MTTSKGTGDKHLVQLIQQTLGQNYFCVANVRRMMMRLRVYAKTELAGAISDVELGGNISYKRLTDRQISVE